MIVELTTGMSAIVFTDVGYTIENKLFTHEGEEMSNSLLIAGCISLLMNEQNEVLRSLIDDKLENVFHVTRPTLH